MYFIHTRKWWARTLGLRHHYTQVGVTMKCEIGIILKGPLYEYDLC
jgi:hypothetical protein